LINLSFKFAFSLSSVAFTSTITRIVRHLASAGSSVCLGNDEHRREARRSAGSRRELYGEIMHAESS